MTNLKSSKSHQSNHSNHSALKKLRKEIFSLKNPSKITKKQSLNQLKTVEKYKILGKKNVQRTIISKKVELPERVDSSGFKDRRVGVMNHSFKQQVFNLEEPLTHMGNELDYDNLSQLSDDDNNYQDHMDKDLTRMNFGGFDLQNDNNLEPQSGEKKSRNEIMKEVILKSKTFKRERQMQKEMDLNVQEDLDKDLEEIRGMLAPMPTRVKSEGKMVINQERLGMLNQSQSNVGGQIQSQSNVGDQVKGQRNVGDQVNGQVTAGDQVKRQVTAGDQVKGQGQGEEEKRSDYDKVLRELAFEKRARPTERQKTEEELALDMAKELQEQEAKRIRRMKGLVSDDDDEDQINVKKRKKQVRQVQADDLGAGYQHEVEEGEETMPLTYKDGVLVNKEIFMKAAASESDSNSCSGSESGSDSGSESESGSESGSETSEIANFENDKDEVPSDVDQAALEAMYDGPEEKEHPRKKLKTEEMQQAAQELPFTFDSPSNYAEFQELIQGRNGDDQILIIKRLKVLYNPKISAENKQKIECLTRLLFEHLLNIDCDDFELLKSYQSHFIDLARNSTSLPKFYNSKLAKLQSTFSAKHKVPSSGYMVIFMDLASIYSTSDLHHSVIAPTTLFLSQVLEQATMSTVPDIYSGLFICNILYLYNMEAKRYLPELINFLHQLLVKLLKAKPPSSLFMMRKITKTLGIENFTALVTDLTFTSVFNGNLQINDSTRLGMLKETISLLIKFCKLWNDVTSVNEVFEITMPLLDTIPTTCNPDILQALSESRRMINPILKSQQLKRRPLQLQVRKAMAIKTYVPKFENSYSLDKRYDPNRDRAQESKSKAEYKKEFKGAVRDLRKDAAQAAADKVSRIKAADAHYKKKMDKIVGGLAEQEGSMRGFEKMKKKGKKKF